VVETGGGTMTPVDWFAMVFGFAAGLVYVMVLASLPKSLPKWMRIITALLSCVAFSLAAIVLILSFELAMGI
jgi:hypothetical protein